MTTTNGVRHAFLWPRALPRALRPNTRTEIDLMLEERVLHLPMREADVAIRMKRTQPSRPEIRNA